MGGKKKKGPDGPEDEYDAMRAQFFADLRRRPADRRSRLQQAESLARMDALLKRMSPRKREELGENLARVLSRYDDLIVPPEEQG